MTGDGVLEGVCVCLASALDVPADSIRSEDRIVDDLGADSLDFLDIIFQLEQRFGISMNPREIEKRAREKLDGKPFEVDGVYTPEALAELREALPEIPAHELADGLTVAELPRKFRAATMASLVERLLGEQSE
ncbi:MAG: acyl carrier protein [Planctomycetota bacterium]|jgi:acyl carrier protein